MWQGNWGAGPGWAWFGLLHMLFWPLLLLALAVLLRRHRDDGFVGGPRRDRACAILRERFARGEIDLADYEQRLQLLQRS